MRSNNAFFLLTFEKTLNLYKVQQIHETKFQFALFLYLWLSSKGRTFSEHFEDKKAQNGKYSIVTTLNELFYCI